MRYILGTLMIILISMTYLLTSIFNHQYEERIREDLKVNCELIRSILHNSEKTEEEVFQSGEFNDFPIRITIVDIKGKVIFDNGTLPFTIGFKEIQKAGN